MKKGFLLVCMTLLSLLGAKAQEMPTLSTSKAEVWYYIKFSNKGNVIADQGEGYNLNTAALVSGDPTQLWKIEEVEAGSQTYILTSMLGNKMAWGGEKYTGDATGVAMALDVTTNTDNPGGWELRRADGEDHINQWGGAGVGKELGEYGYGDINNPLTFVAATEEEVATAKVSAEPALHELAVDRLTKAIEKLTAVASSAVVGTDPGTYSSEQIGNLNTIIANAQAVLDNAESTTEQLNAAATSVKTKILPFYNSVNKPFVVSTPGVKEYYYAIYTPNRANKTLTAIVGETALSLTSYADESSFTEETLPADQKWIITQLADGTYAIVNPKTINTEATEDIYLDPAQVVMDELINTTTTPVTMAGWQIQSAAANAANAPLFIINKGIVQLNNWGGTSTSVGNYGYNLGGNSNEAGYLLDDDGCNYKFVQVGSKTFGTGLKDTKAETISVSVNNGVITVAGADNFEVYSIDGQKQNTKSALQGGVYLVKANGATQKVVVK